MDKSLKKVKRPGRPNPAIVLANWFQFEPGSRLVQTCVHSRMLLWCRKGRGVVTVNGEPRELGPGAWLLLPWGRRMVYQADAQTPFSVGGVHLIPDCRSRPIQFQVAHSATAPLAHQRDRRDAGLPGLRGVVGGHFEGGDRLELLATFVVERFQEESLWSEADARELARLLLTELRRTVGPEGMPSVPGSVRRVQEFLRKHLPKDMSVDAMALQAGVSVAGLHRQFRKYVGRSPGAYLAQLRVERASELLRTTALPVHEVGFQVGLPDPFHFSRFFKRKTGLSPRAYQKSRRVF